MLMGRINVVSQKLTRWMLTINILYGSSDRSLSGKVILTSYAYSCGLRKVYPLTTELKALSC